MKKVLKKILQMLLGEPKYNTPDDILNLSSPPSSRDPHNSNICEDVTLSDISIYEDPFEGCAVEIPIDSSIDLHTFDPSETENLLDAYLPEAYAKGFSQVRIIHGKGIGVQRNIVHSYLNRNSMIKHFHDAPSEAGGWGATIAYFEVDDR